MAETKWGKLWENIIQDGSEQFTNELIEYSVKYEAMKHMIKPNRNDTGVFFGKLTGEELFVGKPTDCDGHVLVVGGAGSGKSSCIAIPTLETWGGTILAIDIKGELTDYWCKKIPKSEHKRPAKIFSFAKEHSGFSTYNPFYFLKQGGDDDLVQNAREIAQSIIQIPPSVLEPFWLQAAQHVLTAAILYGYGNEWGFNETLYFVQSKPLWALLEDIAKSGNKNAVMHISQYLSYDPNKLKGKDLDDYDEIDLSHLADNKMIAGISAELSNKIMVFASDPRIRGAFTPKEDNIRWEDLETHNIFIKIEEDKLGQWSEAITLMLTQLVRTLERRPEIYGSKPSKLPPVLLLLDEFPRLGKVDVIQNAVSTLRSKGVTICLMMQSLAQLDKTHGRDTRKIIVDNCQYKAILNATDPENQRIFSDMVGTVKVGTRSYSDSFSDGGDNSPTSGHSHSITEAREPAIHPHEFANLHKELVLIYPRGFCRVEKQPHPYFISKEKSTDIPTATAISTKGFVASLPPEHKTPQYIFTEHKINSND